MLKKKRCIAYLRHSRCRLVMGAVLLPQAGMDTRLWPVTPISSTSRSDLIIVLGYS